MATETREIEWKYEAAPDAQLPDLTGIAQVESQTEADEQVLEATYHDTDGLDLVRAGITLRQRLGGDDAGWHLKLPEGAGRTELRLPPGGELPAEFAELLTARLRGRAVRPVARITTVRQRSRLHGRAGAALAEVVLDRVSGQTLIGQPPALLRWNEVEIELGPGAQGAAGRRLLEAADQRLRRDGLRRSRHGSKLEAVLAGRLPAAAEAAGVEAAPEPGRSSSAGEAVLAYLRAQIDELVACDPMVRRDAPDSVHRMRVATRRLRSTMRTFRALLREDVTGPLLGELRWLGEALGRSRDEEVLLEHLTASLDQLPVELKLGPVHRRVAGYFAPAEAQSREALLEALNDGRYLTLLDDLDRLASRAALTPQAGRKATAVLPPLVRRALRRTRRRIDAAGSAPPGAAQDVALHAARKAAKRARYAAEAAAPVMGKAARRTTKALKKVQSTLGEHQDSVIAREAIRRLGIRAYGAHENAFTYGVLHQREAERAAVMRERGTEAWRKATRSRKIAWMR